MENTHRFRTIEQMINSEAITEENIAKFSQDFCMFLLHVKASKPLQIEGLRLNDKEFVWIDDDKNRAEVSISVQEQPKAEQKGGWVHILARKPSDDDQQYYFIRGKKSYSMLVVQWDFENQEFILPDDAPTNHFSESNLYWLDEDEIEWEDLDN